MTLVRWTETALADLESIRDYIRHDSPVLAQLVVTRLYVSVGLHDRLIVAERQPLHRAPTDHENAVLPGGFRLGGRVTSQSHVVRREQVAPGDAGEALFGFRLHSESRLRTPNGCTD